MSEAKRQQLIGKAEQTHRLTEAELAALLADADADPAIEYAALTSATKCICAG